MEKDEKDDGKKPTTLIVMGMAGSGKTTFVQRLTASLNMANQERPPYVINLDPAVADLQFPVSVFTLQIVHKFLIFLQTNIDIRDTVKYKEVMKQYGLGPNGAIMTSLNLFSTKFDQVLELIDKRQDQIDNIIIDTPGQIEVFTWSASGRFLLCTARELFICFRVDNHRDTSINGSNGDLVCDGCFKMCITCYIHVQYDVRLFNFIQNRTSLHHSFE